MIQVYRLILPQWAQDENPSYSKVLEGEFTDEELKKYNDQGYNIYWLPNHPKEYNRAKGTLDGKDIDAFEFVFVDMDLKDKVWPDKETFLKELNKFPIKPTLTSDSGNGIHAYWKVLDLDAMSFLRLQRRLMRYFKTDEAVAKIFQLMRMPGWYNTKEKGNPKLCSDISCTFEDYTCEQLDKLLPPITKQDEVYCVNHYNRTYSIEDTKKIEQKPPLRFLKLLKDSKDVRALYTANSDDRSGDDYRLGHILFAEGFSKEDALSVLVNCRKAMERSPVHREGYAKSIVDKIWTYENDGVAPASNSVYAILKRGVAIKGERIKCWDVFDNTEAGFRLTQVLSIIGATGSGKTAITMNYFYWFAKSNPAMIHLFVALEQPEEEIALRWAKVAGDNENLHKKVHVLSNYNSDGSYRNLSLSEIEEHVEKMKKELGVQVGCVVIDHVGVLKKQGKNGENQGLIDVIHGMKAFAKRTNTFLVMQSQTSREKGGIGDVELDKDAAYGTSMLEWYSDWVVTTHQPLKRVYYKAPHMTVTAYKICKIRHKNVHKDVLKEDQVYILMFDPETERLRDMTDAEYSQYDILSKEATIIRNKDRKREPTQITRLPKKGNSDGTATHTQD